MAFWAYAVSGPAAPEPWWLEPIRTTRLLLALLGDSWGRHWTPLMPATYLKHDQQCMLVKVITIRIREDDLRILKEHGVQPAVLCRERLHEEAVRLRLSSARRFLESVSVTPERPGVDQLREDRDAH